MSPIKVAATATTIRLWWENLPAAERKERYRLSDIQCPVASSTAVVGEALRHLGWKREKDGESTRWWIPPHIVRDETKHLKAQIRTLEIDLAAAQKTALNEEAIRRRIVGLKDAINAVEPPPSWLVAVSKDHSAPGVPTLFLSDLHWGEVVKPEQINNVNRYNIKIAKERMHTLVNSTMSLLEILSPKLQYPGIVIVLGGDMISGNIHEELTATNELNSMPTVVDLYGVLVSVIERFASTFNKVFLPCVTGNHGRDTHKVWAKDRHATSFDWLLYTFLQKHFEDDSRVEFMIPDGPDAQFTIYNHRYLLTHGDQFRGGDGLIGALGPIIRGDHKKRSRNSQIDMGYDTMLLGHWHQYMHLTRLIVNGSLKGYDEYAYNSNFGFEQPQQALWLTHPKHGITYRMPVFVGNNSAVKPAEWVSWRKAS
jgi:hypothetical protein